MSNYPLLSKIKYSDRDNYEAEYEKRHDSASAVITQLRIHPFVRDHLDAQTEYALFYLPVPALEFLKDELLANSRAILGLMSDLPESARTKIFLNALIAEIQASNDIEGVESTRKEIAAAIEKLETDPETKNRFAGLVKLYFLFQKEQYNSISEIEDIRKIYDQLLAGEISEDKKPDGRIFRKESISIANATKIVHVGILGEKQIEEKMRDLVKFMNAHAAPSLEKCFISHYYFEYIHPFYDGNGRTGRFIACSYLSRKLDSLSAISFSSAIIKHKSCYINAFGEVSNRNNRGEITHFIIDMLGVVSEGQHHIIQQLTESKEKYEAYLRVVDGKPFSPLEKTILDLLIQQKLFGSGFQSFTDRDLLHEANKAVSGHKISRTKLNAVLSSLAEAALVRQTKRKPSAHILTDEFRKELASLAH